MEIVNAILFGIVAKSFDVPLYFVFIIQYLPHLFHQRAAMIETTDLLEVSQNSIWTLSICYKAK